MLSPDLMAFVDLGSTALPTGSPGTVCFPIPVVICWTGCLHWTGINYIHPDPAWSPYRCISRVLTWGNSWWDGNGLGSPQTRASACCKLSCWYLRSLLRWSWWWRRRLTKRGPKVANVVYNYDDCMHDNMRWLWWRWWCKRRCSDW